MPSYYTARGKQQAVLNELAKLEMRLREDHARHLRYSDEARKRGEHGNRAFWSGYADSKLESANLVSQLYQRILDITGWK